jgi:hypothetical protein
LRPLLGMSYALVFGLILAAIAAVALLGGLIWWIRRPVPVARRSVRSVRFSVPTDATLQFLPGRLEITNGADRGRDLRFVRMPGAAITEITFGRCAGAPYRHVQLEDATVSRKHARLRLQQQRWHLTNWSSTNPVLHNGVELAVDEEVALSDGDRVDMGEVIFRFRA